MAGWLDKILPPSQSGKRTNLPSIQRSSGVPARPRPSQGTDKLPNASVIYGIAAAALFAIGLYFLVTGMWFTGLMLFLPAGCFLGFALHYLKHGV